MAGEKSRREQIMHAALKDQRRRRRERLIILVLVLLVGGLFYLALHFSKIAEQSTLIQPFIVYFGYFAFWAFLLVLTLVLVFLIVRNVVKFFFERKRGVLGAKIRVRLVAAFMALTLGPAAVLFLLSTFILNTAIEQLHDPHFRNVVKTSKDVIDFSIKMGEVTRQIIESKYDADGEEAVHFAQEFARAILERGWINVLAGEEGRDKAVSPGQGGTAEGGGPPAGGDTVTATAIPTGREQLTHFIEYKRQEYNLAVVVVFNRDGKRVVRSSAPEVSVPPVPEADISKAISGEQGYIPPVAVEKGSILFAFYPVPRRAASGETEIAGAVVVGRLISWNPEQEWHDSGVAEEAKAVIQDYETMSRLERPIKFSYFLLLVFVTLIVIFLAIWFGFRMSKGITEPIQLLAEGTEMVASGNLDYRIDLPTRSEDEIATLVRSFNKMTGDLQRNRKDLDLAYSSLHDSNLELEQRRKYMETVLAHVTAGVISVNADNRVSTINPAALAMLGLKEESRALGRPLSELFGPEEMELFSTLTRELDDKDRQIVQRQITMSRDKRSYVVLITLSRLPSDRGGSLGTVIVIDDMTELIRAHRAMAWREVARRIAHEIKNPLTPVQLAAQRLERRYVDRLEEEDAKIFTECTRTIITQVEELKHLVNEFSLFARLPSTSPEPSDLHEIIGEVLSLYREAHPDISFVFEQDRSLPPLELDPEQIKRVFINLIDNSVASIAGKGEIRIETMYNPKLQVARVELNDDGAGITAQARERLFEPYYSTKPNGTGLGLAIVHRIISDHYGYVRVTDNSPRGTRVIIELPVVLAERRIEPDGEARTL